MNPAILTSTDMLLSPKLKPKPDKNRKGPPTHQLSTEKFFFKNSVNFVVYGVYGLNTV